MREVGLGEAVGTLSRHRDDRDTGRATEDVTDVIDLGVATTLGFDEGRRVVREPVLPQRVAVEGKYHDRSAADSTQFA